MARPSPQPGSPKPITFGGPAERLPLGELVAAITRSASLLVRKEVELAKVELRHDLKAEIRTAIGLGVAGACGLVAFSLFLVTAASGIATAGITSEWVALLVLGAVVTTIGVIAAIVGWKTRVTAPLQETRVSLQENIRWAKDHWPS